jgi:hypothetical protein
MIGTEQPGQPVAYQFMRQDVLPFVLPVASVSKRAVFITKLSRVRPYYAVYAHEAYLSRQIMVDWQCHHGRCSMKTRSLRERVVSNHARLSVYPFGRTYGAPAVLQHERECRVY